MKERIYLVLLHNIGISQKYLHIIFKKQQNYREIYENAVTHDFLKWVWIRLKQREYILQKYAEIKIDDIKKKLESREVNIIVFWDDNYPEPLESIANPPYLMYVRWVLDNSPKIAVVGSRKMTGYGKRIIENIVPDISRYFTIVSWWAAWVDTLSHKVSMEHWNKTISVIWTGICQDYPVDNKKLYDEIVKSGWAVISIFGIDEVWNPYNFPIRNEIVVGLSVWIFVVEAQERSWSLITARLALESGRDVFTCPGDIFCSSSVWCNRLIKRWEAKSVFKSEHILEEYSIAQASNKTDKKKISFDDEIQEKIYNILLLENIDIDTLSQKLDLQISALTSQLSLLEIKGYISRGSDGKYSIK